MRILFLSAWFPFPPVNGSKIRISNLLKVLALRHEIDLLSFSDCSEQQMDLADASQFCRNIALVPSQSFNPESSRAILNFVSFQPRSLKTMFSAQMAEQIRKLIGKSEYDWIIASETKMAAYYRFLGNVPAMFEDAEVGILHDDWVSAKNAVWRLRARLTWEKHRAFLSRLAKRFSVTTVVSERERELFSTAIGSPARVEVIPNCIDFETFKGLERKPVPNEMLFTGSFTYFPNYQAIQWFVAEILPRVLERIPEARLVITGDQGDKHVAAGPAVEHLGFVQNVRSRFLRASAVVVPLLQGGGTRLKILEAMAMGVPVVSTSKGAEGLNVTEREHLLIADSPDEFASCCVELLGSPALSTYLTQNAQVLVELEYDWKNVGQRFLELLEERS